MPSFGATLFIGSFILDIIYLTSCFQHPHIRRPLQPRQDGRREAVSRRRPGHRLAAGRSSLHSDDGTHVLDPSAEERRKAIQSTLAQLLAAAGVTSGFPLLGEVDAEAATGEGRTVVYNGPIQKSPRDVRQYKALTLPNGLRVLLATDPQADSAAAALAVHVGHFSDPENLPGLAHFCEHMLFLGTEKYPDEGSFEAFLSSNGGSSNAFTDNQDTCYFFDIANQKKLREALDRFSSFFIAPLFTEAATNREVNAIESENSKNLQSDEWRLQQLFRSRANPSHPFHRFGTGNLLTLRDRPQADGVNVRNALLDFYSQYYSANTMTLCIVSAEPLSTMQKWSEQMFAGIRNTARPPPEAAWAGKVPPFPPALLAGDGYQRDESDRAAQLTEVVPVQQLRRLHFAWAIPYSDEGDRLQNLLIKPDAYVGHMLGHEGKGSLLSYLKREGLATGLGCSTAEDTSDFEVFEVRVSLTKKGFEQRDEVAKSVFSYINMLRDSSVPRHIFDDCQRISELNWQFQEKSGPESLAVRLAPEIQVVKDPLVYLSGTKRLFLDDRAATRRSIKPAESDDDVGMMPQQLTIKFIQNLTPQRVLVTCIAKDFEGTTDKTEEWYGTPYRERLIRETTLEEWAQQKAPPDLTYPPANPFIPSDVSLKFSQTPDAGRQPLPPEIIRDDGTWRVFYKGDRKFGTPKAYGLFSLSTNAPLVSPENQVLSRLYELSVNDDLNEFAYDAGLAGLSYGVDFNAKGLQLSFGGYNDKLQDFVERVSRRIATHMPTDEDKFSRFQDIARREFAAFDNQQPYEHARYFISRLTEIPTPSVEAVRQALEKLTLSDLQRFSSTIFESGGFGETLIQGNLQQSEAKKLVATVENSFPFTPLPPDQRPTRRVVELPRTPSTDKLSDPPSSLGEALVLRRQEPNVANPNSAASLVFQIGDREMKNKLTAQVVRSLLESPFYSELRTKQQLGYIVGSGLSLTSGIPSLRFVIQSSVADPETLVARAADFLDDFRRTRLAKLTQRELDGSIAAERDRILRKDQQLAAEVYRHWAEINIGTYRFGRQLEEAEMLRGLKVGDVLSFWDTYIGRGGRERRVLSCEVYASKYADRVGRELLPQYSAVPQDEDAFVASRPLFPRLEPAIAINNEVKGGEQQQAMS